MLNSGQGNKRSGTELTEQEATLLRDFLAFSSHKKASPDHIEGHLLASLALALAPRVKRC